MKFYPRNEVSNQQNQKAIYDRSVYSISGHVQDLNCQQNVHILKEQWGVPYHCKKTVEGNLLLLSLYSLHSCRCFFS